MYPQFFKYHLLLFSLEQGLILLTAFISIVIQIRWKFIFLLFQISIQRPLQFYTWHYSYADVTTLETVLEAI